MNKKQFEDFLVAKYDEREDMMMDLTERTSFSTLEVVQLLADIIFENFEIKIK